PRRRCTWAAPRGRRYRERRAHRHRLTILSVTGGWSGPRSRTAVSPVPTPSSRIRLAAIPTAASAVRSWSSRYPGTSAITISRYVSGSKWYYQGGSPIRAILSQPWSVRRSGGWLAWRWSVGMGPVGIPAVQPEHPRLDAGIIRHGDGRGEHARGLQPLPVRHAAPVRDLAEIRVQEHVQPHGPGQ